MDPWHRDAFDRAVSVALGGVLDAARFRAAEALDMARAEIERVAGGVMKEAA